MEISIENFEHFELNENAERKYVTTSKIVDGVVTEVVSGYSHELKKGGHLFFCGIKGHVDWALRKRIILKEFGNFSIHHSVEDNREVPIIHFFYIAERGL